MRATYLLPCKCGASLRVTSVQAGETLRCSTCGTEVTVPALRDLEEFELADKPRRRRHKLRWGARKILITLGLYVTAGSLIALAILWAKRPELPDPSTLTPLESWRVWMALRQGLNRQVSWDTYQLIESQKNLRLCTFVCLSTAAIGVCMSLLSFLVRKRRVPIQ